VLPYSPLFLPHLPALWLQFPVALDEAVPLTCFALLQLASCAGAAAGTVMVSNDREAITFNLYIITVKPIAEQ
jgi:hypothetical protein